MAIGPKVKLIRLPNEKTCLRPQKAAKYLFHYPFSILEMHSVSVWEELGKTKLSSSGYAP